MKTLLFLFFTFSAYAQPTAELDKFCEKTIHQQRIQSDRADWLAQKLLRAYHNGGEEAVDAVLETADDTWYSGMDLYMSNNATSIIRAMTQDLDAEYRDTSIKKATVKVAYDGRNYMVVIWTYKS